MCCPGYGIDHISAAKEGGADEQRAGPRPRGGTREFEFLPGGVPGMLRVPHVRERCGRPGRGDGERP